MNPTESDSYHRAIIYAMQLEATGYTLNEADKARWIAAELRQVVQTKEEPKAQPRPLKPSKCDRVLNRNQVDMRRYGYSNRNFYQKAA